MRSSDKRTTARKKGTVDNIRETMSSIGFDWVIPIPFMFSWFFDNLIDEAGIAFVLLLFLDKRQF